MENIDQNLKTQVLNESSFENINRGRGFVEKYYDHLKWSISFYHLFFALWGTLFFLQSVLPAISKLIYTIPLLAFIIASIVGGYRLLMNKPNAYNYLIAAQVPQVIVLQFNGMIYFLLIGQWIIFKISGFFHIGLFFGLFDAKYAFLFGNPEEISFLLGINILPIILIFILLKMEEVKENRISEDKEKFFSIAE